MYYKDKFEQKHIYKAVRTQGIFTILKSVSLENGTESLSEGEIWCVPSHLRDLYEKCEAPV